MLQLVVVLSGSRSDSSCGEERHAALPAQSNGSLQRGGGETGQLALSPWEGGLSGPVQLCQGPVAARGFRDQRRGVERPAGSGLGVQMRSTSAASSNRCNRPWQATVVNEPARKGRSNRSA